jgi:hypothetical protein
LHVAKERREGGRAERRKGVIDEKVSAGRTDSTSDESVVAVSFSSIYR